MKKYRVASRPSLLAFSQTEQTVRLLQERFPQYAFEIIKFTTHGDRQTDTPLTSFGGTGVFVKELETALLEGKADFAIHSLKDVPSIQPEGLTLASFPKREDPRDVILMRDDSISDFRQLDEHCIIGTGSPRRILQLKQQKKEALYADLRGNIDTRLRKLNEGQYDAIVVAAAGLKRIGKVIPENGYLPVEVCIPAIGQGALAIECRKDDRETYDILRAINDAETETSVIAERSFMLTVGGGCKFPLAAYATIEGSNIRLRTMTGDHITGKIVYYTGLAPVTEAEHLGIASAHAVMKLAKEQGIILQN
ncbi:hydroxymethylbilane synthase [Microbacter margulisiae]|uniref:Porphobilinogen deaminase n=1 Tax=Microbacter margulisiae TaxID=1350067 RepID=A0A7W5DNC9_9PORP|nr:hydroxymethylbilane synthase [Microbacter margulisiae]MBB3186115.1 hydroxymethylbilane synthase [Microbacter margulisiae]